ncbi:MAG: galactose mutarotase [Pelosinus sp.]|nr:galactose mutarotase [Pelosinus sp.]
MKKNYTEVQPAAYEKELNGKQIHLYTLKNKHGMIAKITNYAAKLVQLLVPDKNNQLTDVVLGYDTIEQAIKYQPFMGSTIARFANRIGKGQFKLNGKSYQLTINDNTNHLHGGLNNSSTIVFDAIQLDEKSIEFTCYFKDGVDGFPGNFSMKTTYTLTDDNELKIVYDAVTDKPTIVNLTNHAFFNLAGAGNGDILNHEMQINADRFTPIDQTLIPTGKIQSVKGTPLDFTTPHKIGERINDTCDQLQYGLGYDFNYCLTKKADELSLAAKVSEPTSGLIMEVFTTEPGIQLYSGNFIKGELPEDEGKGGKLHVKRGGFCLETQHFPDSPNKPEFPSTVLNPGEWFSTTTIYKFSAK